MSEVKVNAYFEPADNIPIELTDTERSTNWDFGTPVRICAITASHGNDDYVTVKIYKFGDTKPFWEHKFMPGLNGQVFIQPIPKEAVRKIVVEVEPKPGITISDTVLVNISYI
ncbi:hypothetical protein APY94_02995 [Thermococcus celericrescens]|uniref:Uncharacterized protein n=1 Tax=Thermococcus celericrescens TaxID=227598 RepID=A0A100XZ70_9EURY|nr:hypothetical protein [Thermococcus celericrescens]KUH34257.1 hypothetical protein APY94_02995 [Thermococcus celericrescens]